jgi:hypothetical protein
MIIAKPGYTKPISPNWVEEVETGTYLVFFTVFFTCEQVNYLFNATAHHT